MKQRDDEIEKAQANFNNRLRSSEIALFELFTSRAMLTIVHCVQTRRPLGTPSMAGNKFFHRVAQFCFTMLMVPLDGLRLDRGLLLAPLFRWWRRLLCVRSCLLLLLLLLLLLGPGRSPLASRGGKSEIAEFRRQVIVHGRLY